MNTIDRVRAFLDASHSQYHAIYQLRELLLSAGYEEKEEAEPLSLEKGKGYFFIRNDSSIIAFNIPESGCFEGFRIAASHSDSPSFKIKPNPIVTKAGETELRVEPYGGMLMSTWLDRPLSVAGRIMVKNGDSLKTRLFDIDEDIAIIPNLCIHFNREANSGYAYNPDVDMVPLLGELGPDFSWEQYLARKSGLKEGEELLGEDLFLVNREKSRLVGVEQQYLCAPKLDNLTSAITSLLGFLEAKESNAIKVFVCFDNEEVGSSSRQGADSSFLLDCLSRIARQFGKEIESLIASSFMVSIDNAHARHPNHPGTFEQSAEVSLNGGIVIKYNAFLRYTSDAFSAGLVKEIAKRADVPVQLFSNRPDIRGGGTLGSLSLSHASLPCADIGLAQLAMHSSYETMGVDDLDRMRLFCKTYFEERFIVRSSSIDFE